MTLHEAEEFVLRPATLEDAELLLKWRNDPETRRASREADPVTKKEHAAWLAKSLLEPTRRLCIAEKDGGPVGVVRADYFDGVHQLSWTVAPDARGRGLGRQMVAQFARELTGVIRAEVRKGNWSSAKIAESLGMHLEKEADGFLYYVREPSRG